MAALTAQDIIDLDRWHAIQFGSQEAAQTAIERYRRYRARIAQRGSAQPSVVEDPEQHDRPDLAA